MPLEVASTIDQLVATNPAATDSEGQGDDHLRLIKAVLQTTFPNLVGVCTSSTANLNAIPTIQANVTVLQNEVTGMSSVGIGGGGTITLSSGQYQNRIVKLTGTGPAGTTTVVFPAAPGVWVIWLVNLPTGTVLVGPFGGATKDISGFNGAWLFVTDGSGAEAKSLL